MPFPETEGCFRGFSGSAILAQPAPPGLSVQTELWERRCGGGPGLPLLAPLGGQYGPTGGGHGASLISLNTTPNAGCHHSCHPTYGLYRCNKEVLLV